MPIRLRARSGSVVIELTYVGFERKILQLYMIKSDELT